MKQRILVGLLTLGIILTLQLPVNARADPLPEAATIPGVSGHPQRYSLSCESRSAADWAAFWGITVHEKKFLSQLPRSDNPDAGFVGEPNGAWGLTPPHSYGVHAEPVAALLRQYGLQAEAHRGLTWDDLRTEVAAGRPVIVWVVGQMWPGTPVKYKASDGHKTTVASFEHTMILIGYTASLVQVVDAYSGQTQSYGLRAFLASWKTLGNMAVTGSVLPLVPTPTPPPAAEPTVFPPMVGAILQSEDASVSPLKRIYFPFAVSSRGQNSPLVETPSSPDAYSVRPGEYLMSLAQRFDLDWQVLARINGIGYPYVIHPGQVLRLR